jgi:hypothetical protein
MANELTSAESAEDNRSRYERDYYSWALQQARAVEKHRLEDLEDKG